MIDILSNSIRNLIQKPEVLKAIHALLDNEGLRAITVMVDGKQVELTRVP